jgi:anti-sigma B factor antagonist
MATTLETQVHRDGDIATVVLTGDVDGGAREALDAAYTQADGAGTLLLDFAAVSYINSTGIALIVGLLGRARADGVSVAACRLSPHYREIFEITRLSDFISIHADEPSARAAAQGGPQ